MSAFARHAAAPPRFHPTLERKSVSWQARVSPALPLALAMGSLYLLLGLYINLKLHYISGDAFSRVANAYAALYGRDPHLAAIGFVWNPLPSIMEIPLLLFHNVWPSLAYDGMAGVFLSAAFAAVAVYFLAANLDLLGVDGNWRTALTLLFAVNPMVVLYSVNGMTDIMLVGAYLAAVRGVVAFVQRSSLGDLFSAGTWLAVAFGIRYEAAPIGICMAVGMAVGLYRTGLGISAIRGAMLILLAPLLYVSGIWIYFNWLIVKNPLYFLDSAYSNVSQTTVAAYVVGDQALQHAKHSILGSLLFVGHMGLLFWPVFIGCAATLVLMARSHHSPEAAVLLGATAGMPLLQTALVFLGHSGGWARYFIYYIPSGFLLLGYAAGRPDWARLRRWELLLTSLSLVLGDIVTFQQETTSNVVGYGDLNVIRQILENRPFRSYANDDRVVAYLDAHPSLSVLMDLTPAFPIFLRVKDPDRLVISPDLEFQSILTNPRGRVGAILVPAPSNGLRTINAVDRAWPTLWAGRLHWAHRIADFAGQYHWRLYLVGPDAP